MAAQRVDRGIDRGVYVCVTDVDAHHARAVAAGATIERGLQNTDYGSREYTARDHQGHLWSFGTYGMTTMESAPVFSPGLRYQSGSAAVDFLTRAFSLEPGELAREQMARSVTPSSGWATA